MNMNSLLQKEDGDEVLLDFFNPRISNFQNNPNQFPLAQEIRLFKKSRLNFFKPQLLGISKMMRFYVFVFHKLEMVEEGDEYCFVNFIQISLNLR